MSQKINSNALRLGINKTWKSVWYAKKHKYTDQLHEDLKIRNIVTKELGIAGLDEVVIKRSIGKMEVLAYVAKPGIAIGRGGSGIDQLNKKIKKVTDVKNVDIKINEVSNPDMSAAVLASEIESGLIRRMPAKLLAQNALQKARGAGALGVKIWIAGRINGNSQARTVKWYDGPVPLTTLKADIDYVSQVAETKDYGKFGIKVWVYRPEKAE